MITDQISYVLDLLEESYYAWKIDLYDDSEFYVIEAISQILQLKEMMKDEISRLQKN